MVGFRLAIFARLDGEQLRNIGMDEDMMASACAVQFEAKAHKEHHKVIEPDVERPRDKLVEDSASLRHEVPCLLYSG